MGKKKIGLLAGVLVLVCAGATGCGEKTIDLSDYVSTTFEGINSKGTAYVSFDDSLSTAITAAMGINGNLDDLTGGKYQKAIAALQDLRITANQTQFLSNGDKISVAVSYDNDAAKACGIKFKYSTVEATVSGLQECTVLTSDQAFAGLDISCEGVSPNLYLTMQNTSTDSVLQDIYYYAEPNEGLKNGDIVTVYADLDKYVAEENGYLLPDGGISMEMTIEGMNEYVTDTTQMTADNLSYMKAQATDLVNAKIARESGTSWGITTSFSAPTPYKLLLKTAKSADNGMQNEVALIYTAKETTTNSDGTVSSDKYYLIVADNVPINQNSQLDVDVTEMYMDDVYNSYDDLYRDWAQSDAADYVTAEAELS